MEKIITLDEPQTIHCNTNNLDLGAAVLATFCSRCFDWFRLARLNGKKIRVVIDYDPIDGKVAATFSKRD